MSPEILERTADTRAGENGFLEPRVLSALLSQIAVAVILLDRAGQLLYANDAARVLCGRGGSFHRDAVLQLPPTVEWPVARALLTGEGVRDDEFAFTDAYGRDRWLCVSITPVQSADADGPGAVVTLVDSTDCRRLRSWEPIMQSLTRM